MSSGGDLEVESANFLAVDVSWVGLLACVCTPWHVFDLCLVGETSSFSISCVNSFSSVPQLMSSLCVDSSDPIDDGRLGNDAIVNCSRTVLELFCLSLRN